MKIKAQNLPLFSVVLFSFNLLVVLILVIILPKLPPEIPLFYGNPRGEGQLGTKATIIIPSAVSVLVVVANTALLRSTKDTLITGILKGSALAATVLSFITTFRIVMLIGNF